MKQISKEYLLLFNAITDTENTLRQLQEHLIFVQQQAEALFVEGEEHHSEQQAS